MAKCEFCAKEMTTAETCKPVLLVIDGRKYERERHEGEERCGDCGVVPGGYHHLGCDQEDCPCCGMQLIMCDCEIK